MLGSYIASTSYHACPAERPLKQTLRKFDHAAIYWHIAGSYSPITLVAMRDTGWWGWGLFIFVWLCATAGTILSMYKLKKHNKLETVCYVLMGMVVLVAFKPLLEAVSFSIVAWIIAEGVCYITGAVLYSFHKVKYIHTVFHFFVLLGTICHMIAVWYVINGNL
jgi:hemolysin III